MADTETYDVVGAIMDYEQGEQSAAETLELFSHLIKSGQINHLQGSYGRAAANMIDGGFLTPEGDLTDFAHLTLEMLGG